MIHLDNLFIGYRTKHGPNVVASGLSADIRGGELTCLLGANGVGKSTLLRTLSAFQPKLGGHIYIKGKELDVYTHHDLARLLGVVLTERPEMHNLSVEDLIGLGRSPYTGFWGTLQEEDRAAVARAATLVGIGELLGRMADTLSDGERQKVMIAKALAQDTPVILLDEPTAFLDYPSWTWLFSWRTRSGCWTRNWGWPWARPKIWLWTARCPVTFPVPASLSIPPADCSGWILPARVESVSWAQGHGLR